MTTTVETATGTPLATIPASTSAPPTATNATTVVTTSVLWSPGIAWNSFWEIIPNESLEFEKLIFVIFVFQHQ